MRYTGVKVASIALTLVLLGAASIVTGCAGGDMATVTINTGIHRQASSEKAPLFERMLAFLRPGTTVYAESAIEFDDAIAILNVTITGPGMSAIKKDIPLDTGILSIDVPSGPSRVFTVVAYHDYTEEIVRMYGGIATKDLAPGENAMISIQMGYLAASPEYYDAYRNYGAPGVYIYWSYETEPLDLIGFIIYRSSQPGGPFIPIAAGRKEDFDNDGYRFDDPTGIWEYGGPAPTYYKIAATNPYGEGQSTYEFYAYC
jgi:hypothetical protein